MTYFFDLDGTLTDSQEGILKCVRYALESRGITENDYEKLKRFIGPPLTNAFMEIYGVDGRVANELLHKYRERFSTVGMFENKLYDGVYDMLKNLKAERHTMAVVTGKPQVYSEKIAEHFDIAKFFDAIVGPDLSNIEEGKVSLVKRALELTGGKNAVMIGDRKFDIEGAKANNISSVAVLYGFGSREELEAAKADYFAESVHDLQNLLLDGKKFM